MHFSFASIGWEAHHPHVVCNNAAQSQKLTGSGNDFFVLLVFGQPFAVKQRHQLDVAEGLWQLEVLHIRRKQLPLVQLLQNIVQSHVHHTIGQQAMHPVPTILLGWLQDRP